MTNEELTKFLYFLNKEYGDRGWEGQGQMSLDAYGPESLSGREGWEDILKDQLKYNQYDVHKDFGLLDNREDIEQVLRSRLEDNPDYQRINFLPTAKSMMRTNGIPVEGSNLGFSSPTYGMGPGYSRLSTNTITGGEGYWPIGSGASHGGPGSHEAALRNTGIYSGGTPQLSAYEGATGRDLYQAPQLLSAGPSGYASLDAAADTGVDYAGQGISEELAAEYAAEAGKDTWGGPATFAANQALNLIPTRDRKKKVTPFGDEGSVSGILKGTGKGALLGATIGSYVAPGPGTLIGGLIGGGAGLIGGSQGYFDSTSAPIMNMTRIKQRGGGMQGGLLGGGSMYG